MAYPSLPLSLSRFNWTVRAALIFLTLSCVAGVPVAAAQAVSGSIGGLVKDSSGAIVPGATITITSLDR